MPKVVSLQPNIDAARRYAERCRVLREIGHKPMILSKRTHPDQWAKWKAYYRDKGLLASLDLMNDGRNEMTVMTLDPFTFDHPEPLDQRKPYRED